MLSLSLSLVIASPPGGARSMARWACLYVCVSVCLYVCVYVCMSTHISQKPHVQSFRNFLYIHYLRLWLALSLMVVQSIYYVLPVLWITSCFHTVGQNQFDDVVFGRVRHVAAQIRGHDVRLWFWRERNLLFSIALFLTKWCPIRQRNFTHFYVFHVV